MDYHRDPVFLCFAIHGLEPDLAQTSYGYLHSLTDLLVRLFAGKPIDSGLSRGNILGSQAPSNPEAGADHTVQAKGSQGVPDLFYLWLGDLSFLQRDPIQVQSGPSGAVEAAEDIGRDLCRYEEVTAALTPSCAILGK